jgi:hypothetical protein
LRWINAIRRATAHNLTGRAAGERADPTAFPPPGDPPEIARNLTLRRAAMRRALPKSGLESAAQLGLSPVQTRIPTGETTP